MHGRVPALSIKLDGEDVVLLLLLLLLGPDRRVIGAESQVLGSLSLVGPEKHVERRVFMACRNGNGRSGRRRSRAR